MQYSWLHQGKAKKLIVFCNGWGMDANPFTPLTSEKYDVLNLYDFKTMDIPDQSAILSEEYLEKILIGWSMGVWVGQHLFHHQKDIFSRTVAINGTLCPIHDTFGIPHDLFAGTMRGWSAQSRSKFYHRMCRNPSILECFLDHQPHRAIEDQQAELGCYLEITGCIDVERALYDEVIVTDRDRIVPTAHQMLYWGRERVRTLPGSHFPFYSWSSWDALIEDI